MNDIAIEKALFDKCLDLPEGERLTFIDTECSENPELRDRLVQLLKAHNDAQSHKTAFTLENTLDEFQDEIEGYKITEVLSEGGMGIVLLAEQKEPVRRKVAIKIIKPGMDTREVLGRFELEKRALAIMSHPNIAQILSAGQSKNGRPFFVMEYVPGWPITQFCKTHQLSLKERLELFISICVAVQHAHQRGIIHRDIKPANILVYEHNNTITAKIIDFGIAKAMHGHFADVSLHTRVGGLIGTPDYMSPEQADPFNIDVDTRTDVYSLGAVLYHLLTGEPPLKLREKENYHDIQKALNETEPERPSTRISRRRSDIGMIDSNAAARSGPLPEADLIHARKVKGELDWICMKALAKQRSQRYGSAQELADDLKRYLNGVPVLAAPPSRIYALHKFIERNKLSSTLGLIAVVITVGFSIQSYRQYQIIKAERDKASYQTTVLKQVSSFLVNLFRASNPGHGGHREASAGEILEKAKANLLVDLPTPSAERIYMLETLSDVYSGIGRFSDARQYAIEAVDDALTVYGENSSEYVNSSIGLLKLLSALRDWPEIIAISPRLIKIHRNISGESDETGAILKSAYAIALRNMKRNEEAIALLEKTIPQLASAQGELGTDVLAAMSELSFAYYLTGRMDDAYRLAKELLPAAQRKWGEEHSITLNAKYDLALHYFIHGENARASSLIEDVLEIRSRLYGPDHYTTLVAQSLKTDIMPDDETKRTTLNSIYDKQSEKLGQLHRDTLDTQARIVSINWTLDKNTAKTLAEAQSLLDRMIPLVSSRHYLLAQTYLVLADACLESGKNDQAAKYYDAAITVGASESMLLKFSRLKPGGPENFGNPG